MSFIVRTSKLAMGTDAEPACLEFPDAIEEAHYPNDSLIERRASANTVETDSTSSSCSSNAFVQATLVLLPATKTKSGSLWKKTKAAFGHTPPNYEILFLQEREDKAPIGYTLYMGPDASEAMSAFDSLNNTLGPLMRDGSILLNETILREIILPKPLTTSQISFHLIEIMETNPRAFPEWHKLLQVLLHNACSRQNKDEIKLLLAKGGSLEQGDNDGNTPIHTAAASSTNSNMNWLLKIAPSATPVLMERRNSEGLSPIDIARGKHNLGAARVLMKRQVALHSAKSVLDIFDDDEEDGNQKELLQAVGDNNSQQIWEYCQKEGLTSVQVRGRRKAVNLKNSPLTKQNTVDIRSKNGITPLMMAIEKQYVKSTLLLLLGGADPDQHHAHTGDTPLHYAIRVGNLTITKMLLVFGADPTLSNEEGITSLKLAKEMCGKISEKIIESLEEFTALQEKTWSYFVNNSEVPEKKKEKETYLLAMDGGGIRCFNLSQAFIAIEDRMKQLQPRCKSFFSHFDYIAGTSAGAIATLMAAYTDATPSVNRALAYKVVTDVFAQPKAERGRLMDKYLKEILGEDTRLSHPCDQRVIVTTTLADCCPSKLHLMTSYGEARDGQSGPSDRRLWEAAKASSAAPYFFPTFEGKFMDGGLMANNPTLDAMVEICSQAEREGIDKVKIGCVLSLGTGYAPSKQVDNVEVFMSGFNFKTISSIQETLSGLQSLLQLFITQVTQSDGQEVQRAKTWCKSLGTPYFRLSPALTEEIDPLSCDEEAIINMLYQAQKHILNNPEMIDSIAKCILSKNTD